MAENDYFTLSEPEKSWLIAQYDSVRNEIAGRASNHHAMFSWAAAIVAAVTVFAPNALQEWDSGKKGLVIGIGLAVVLVVLGAIIAALLSVRHTRRLRAVPQIRRGVVAVRQVGSQPSAVWRGSAVADLIQGCARCQANGSPSHHDGVG